MGYEWERPLYSIEEMPVGYEFPGAEYGKFHTTGNRILDATGTVVAYAWFTISEDRMMCMSKLEVLQKRKGHGTAIIHFLFEKFNLAEIYGIVMQEMGGRPYYFWQSVGAEIGEEYFFQLRKENLKTMKELTQ